jgi:RHH-type proline utilization regulon transcriptional repressor/proline dehydrogenase/delta 1-pyrroline-5-carboxylate dehydrogenase
VTSDQAERLAADAGAQVEPAVELAASWLSAARGGGPRRDQRTAGRLAGLVGDPDGMAFALRFVDRVLRPEHDRVAAAELAALVAELRGPRFLGPVDRGLLALGGRLAPAAPRLVMPLARHRMRKLVGHLAIDPGSRRLTRHLAARRAEGMRVNLNLLGEAVLGDEEARRRLLATIELARRPDVDYVSVKVSAVCAHLDVWSFEHTVDRVVDQLRPLYRAARDADPPTFVNLDMEEHRDLALTVAACRRVLDEPDLTGIDAGIALQAYLPETIEVVDELVAWAADRHRRSGGTFKVRLVKGANLAMERVDAALHGWPQAPLPTKADVDAAFARALDRLLDPGRLGPVRVGVASHNAFHVAWALLVAEARGVADHVDVEMLEGMAPGQARLVNEQRPGLILYTPLVRRADFDTAISYLVRRLEETAAPDNFLRSLPALDPGGPAFAEQAARFRASVRDRHRTPRRSRRVQDRRTGPPAEPDGFANEPDTDPTTPGNRRWIADLRSLDVPGQRVAQVTTVAEVDRLVARAVAGQAAWAGRGGAGRREVLRSVARELAGHRAVLIATMVAEGAKVPAEADTEVSEAVDLARCYAEQAAGLDDVDGALAAPLGTVVVTPPWNFPVAIPTGGMLAALAAGDTVVVKPAPETPRCVELVVELCHLAGVPEDALVFAPCGDDETGERLVRHPDTAAVVLTGSLATAELFLRWRPSLRLVAETSGKNAIVVTPHADLDLAVADLVRSAFGHAGQKCSAASLAILVGDVARSERFRRQLVDAATSLRVGPAGAPGTEVPPLIGPPSGPLARVLDHLEPGQRWLVRPRVEGRSVSPGIIDGVEAGSWFATTECFGPVLGLVRATDLADAVRIQNSTRFGLTGGLHSLHPDEVQQWLAGVEVGNAYVNRTITGAIVQRQPFGGWKGSSVGPGAKAGGPGYVAQLARWSDDGMPTEVADPTPGVATLLEAAAAAGLADDWLTAAAGSDEHWWRTWYGRAHDPAGLFCEANELRFLGHPAVLVRAERLDRRAVRVALALLRAGAAATWSLGEDAPLAGRLPGDVRLETPAQLAARLGSMAGARLRTIGSAPTEVLTAARAAHVDVLDDPVVANGRLELRWYLREQSVSRSTHRFGNVVAGDGSGPAQSQDRARAGRGPRRQG